MKLETIYKTVRSKGGRLTKTRRAIIEILYESGCVLSSAGIGLRLRERKLLPNRSTIYRELLFLVRSNIIMKNAIANKNYYELPDNRHHHHLVCLGCNSIRKVVISNRLQQYEEKIGSDNGFKILNHSLEFYGLCRRCRR